MECKCVKLPNNRGNICVGDMIEWQKDGDFFIKGKREIVSDIDCSRQQMTIGGHLYPISDYRAYIIKNLPGSFNTKTLEV